MRPTPQPRPLGTLAAVVPALVMLAFIASASGASAAPVAGVATDKPVTGPEWASTYNRLVVEIMSPYCHGLTLDNCPTKGAAELRDQIRNWLMEGRTEDWILDELELQYGPSILGAPRMRGMGLVAWLVPPLVFAVGAIGVVVFLRRNTAVEEEDTDAA